MYLYACLPRSPKDILIQVSLSRICVLDQNVQTVKIYSYYAGQPINVEPALAVCHFPDIRTVLWRFFWRTAY